MLRRKLPFIVVASLVFIFVFAGMALASGFTVTLDPVQVGVPRPDALTVSGTVSSGGTGVAGVPVTLKVTTGDGNIIGVEQATSGPGGRFLVVLVMPAGMEPGQAVVTAAAGGYTADRTVAIPLLPAAYYGSVTNTSGQPVSGGKVEAYVGLQKRGEIDFSNGFYGGSGGFDPKLVVTGTEADEGLPVTFKVVVDGKAYDATFSPAVNWQSGDVRRVDLAAAVTGGGGGGGGLPDTDPPVLVSSTPANNASDVAIDAAFTLSFNEELARDASASFVSASGTNIAGNVTVSGEKVVVRLASNLAYNTAYTLKVTVKDLAGNQADVEIAFRTRSAPTGGGGGGGGGGSTSVNRVEKAVSATSKTLAEIADRVRVEIPAGAVTGTNPSLVAELLSDSKAQDSGMSLISRVVDISLKNGTLDGQITIVLYYDKGKLSSNDEPVVFYYDEDKAQWVRLDGTVDDAKGTVTVTVDHLTMFAVFAVAKQEEQPQPPQQAPAVAFKDMQGHWAAETVSRLAGMGVIGGYEDGTFRPNNKITRAEITSILVRALKLQPADEFTFKFVDNNAIPAWARGAVAAAINEGLVRGYPVQGGVAFKAANPITRAELAAILSRVLEDKLGKITGQPVQFADAAKIPAWAKNAVNTAAAAGVVGGYQDGTFRAQNHVTRAEAASMILRLLERVEKQ
jgi:hypothetical protein